MAIICPTVTAPDDEGYRQEMTRVSDFAERVHIDLMDGTFAPTTSIAIDTVWWPQHMQADIHLMYQHPMEHINELIALRPRMVIIHNEADVHHMHFAAHLHRADIEAGLAILHDTPIEWAYQIMHSFDHILVFSGKLGYHGGEADLTLLDKVRKIREHHPDAEIGWDGGINDSNAAAMIEAGVDVLNVGGFIQDADDPQARFAQLIKLV